MTGDSGGSNLPNVINLGPGERQTMMQDQLTAWSSGAKQSLAQYVQMSTLKVTELASTHVGRDMALGPVFNAMNLNSAIETAISFRDAWNVHIKSGVHIAEDATHLMVLPDPDPEEPTALADLIAFLTAQRANYIAHIPNVTYHVTADAINILAAAIPTDVDTSITLLVDLFAKFEKHKRQNVSAGTAPLTPAGILAY